MYRLRRLCSNDNDFRSAIDDLKSRCYNSGYDKTIVDGILNQADGLQRTLVKQNSQLNDENIKTVRWVILNGTSYEKTITSFTRNLNELMKNQSIRFELIKSTSSNLGQLLFNNREKYEIQRDCNTSNCTICGNDLRSPDDNIIGKLSEKKYNIDMNITCENSGIYRITCPCKSAYTGKTTTSFCQRFDEHFQQSSNSSINDHSKSCSLGKTKNQYTIHFLENSLNRGKYTLSEREFLWNERLGGELNVQKILKNSQ